MVAVIAVVAVVAVVAVIAVAAGVILSRPDTSSGSTNVVQKELF